MLVGRDVASSFFHAVARFPDPGFQQTLCLKVEASHTENATVKW